MDFETILMKGIDITIDQQKTCDGMDHFKDVLKDLLGQDAETVITFAIPTQGIDSMLFHIEKGMFDDIITVSVDNEHYGSSTNWEGVVRLLEEYCKKYEL